MKKIVIAISLACMLQGVDVYGTIYLGSKHFDKGLNETHKAYGVEISERNYGASYLHLINSFKVPTDIYSVFGAYNITDEWAIRLTGSYQEGYCDFMNQCVKGEKGRGYMIMPSFTYTNWGLRFEVVPPVIELGIIKVSLKF